jgi:hypothetical protein
LRACTKWKTGHTNQRKVRAFMAIKIFKPENGDLDWTNKTLRPYLPFNHYNII